MVKKFKQGDIININFNHQSGREQKGSRPALVISCNDYNQLSNMVIIAPITSKKRDNIFHFELVGNKKVKGYVMCDQIKMIDPIARKAKYIDQIDFEQLLLALSITKSIISLQDEG